LQTVTPLRIGIHDFEVAGRLRVSCGFVLRVRIKMLTATRMRTRNLEKLCVKWAKYGQGYGKVEGSRKIILLLL
jgi:dissimilatory sulfite reductase (desulfoviridin) alpha/beta subunit